MRALFDITWPLLGTVKAGERLPEEPIVLGGKDRTPDIEALVALGLVCADEDYAERAAARDALDAERQARAATISSPGDLWWQNAPAWPPVPED